MHVFVTGATGLVGRALVQHLLGSGHQVTAWVRSAHRARQRLGPAVGLIETSTSEAELAAVLGGVDAVVNLAGESVLGGAWSSWTPARKRALRTSRVELTAQLVAACRAAVRQPRVFVSASAVGYYGDAGSRVLTEQSAAGTGFLAQLCVDWEQAALGAQAFGARVALLRIGIVLSPDGGALAAMLPAFACGVGGPLGTGEQYLPWIHLADLVGVIVQAIDDPRYAGPIHCTAPEPVTGRAFAAALGAAMGRPAKLRVPALALRAMLGERAQVVLQSQRAEPRVLVKQGFSFQHPKLEGALQQCLSRDAGVSIRRVSAAEGQRVPPRAAYVLEHRSRLEVPIERAFAFFCRAENLGLITPSFMSFELLGVPPQEIREGTEINYRIALGPVPIRWRTVIRSWQPPQMFVDTQEKGPYALWWHEHHLQPDGDATLMLDRVYYRPPLGWLGRVAHFVLIGRMLRAIFGYRGEAIARLFGRRPASAPSTRVSRSAGARRERS